jgi:uncharacterized protein
MWIMKKIAIIGSGIAGLASAHYLQDHDCEIFEAKPFLSLAGHGVKLRNDAVIDIPLRVIHPQYYPSLFSLCRELNIQLRKLEHSGSFALSSVSERFEYFSISLFKKRYNFIKPNWSHFKIGIDFLRFYKLCHKYKNHTDYDLIQFKEFLEKHKISHKHSQMILYPLLSSICTCSYQELDRFPARVLIEMVSMIAGPIPMERFYAGTHDIESALTQNLENIHLSTKVEKLTVSKDGGELIVNGEKKYFDHIVLATEAHIVHEFLAENEHTKDVLSDLKTIPYKSTDTVIHTVNNMDDQVINQKSLHYQEHPNGGEAQASMWLNKVEPHLDLNEQTLQTWNPYEKEMGNELNRISLNRALVTVESYQAVKRLQQFQHPSFSLAGSYLSKRVPLLEGGVASAKRIADIICRNL